jgi:hypothetical protein
LSKLGLPGSVDVEILRLREEATGDATGAAVGGGGGSCFGKGRAGNTLAGGGIGGRLF